MVLEMTRNQADQWDASLEKRRMCCQACIASYPEIIGYFDTNRSVNVSYVHKSTLEIIGNNYLPIGIQKKKSPDPGYTDFQSNISEI